MAGNLKILLLALFLCLLLVTSNGRILQKIKVSHARKLGDTTHRTNREDVRGLVAIVGQSVPLSLKTATIVDPCLPSEWNLIECSNDPTPRVTALYFGQQNLVGFLPDFSAMDALETIDMHNNQLMGSIPYFLGTLPNLKELNLANNLFSGTVPGRIQQNKNLKIDLTGNYGLQQQSPPQYYNPDSFGTGSNETPYKYNPDLRGTDETLYVYTRSAPKRSKRPAIIGGTVSAFAVVSAAVGVFAIFRHKRKTAEAVAQASAAAKNGREATEEAPMNAQSAATTPVNAQSAAAAATTS